MFTKTLSPVAWLLLILSAPAHAADARWGLLANPGWDAQAMRGVYFFSGEGACQASEKDSATPLHDPSIPALDPWPCHGNPDWWFNSKHYTYTPTDSRDLHWIDSPENRIWAVNQIASTHANVIVMSRWGGGINNGAPMQTTVASNDELFAAVDTTGNILIMPAIDTADTRGGYRDFRTSFPSSDGGELWAEVEELVWRYLIIPRNGDWSARWAQMYNKDGQRRYAINWIHAASTIVHDTNGCAFANGLDAIADRVAAFYGVDVGFTIDPFTANLDADGDGFLEVNCGNGYCPLPNNSSCLLSSRAFLGIQGFSSEIVRAGDYPKPSDPWAGVWKTPPQDANARLGEAIAWKRNWIAEWVALGVPVILDLSPGYDGRYVFADAGGVIFGDNAGGYRDEWRNALSALKGTGIKGAVFNAWNGYTEGLVATPGRWVVPQNERAADGRPDDGLKNWLTDFFAVEPRTCDHYHWIDFGAIKHHVYGDICKKWQGLGAEASFLGAPASSEREGCDGARRNLFQYGAIVFSRFGTRETHGLIGEKYRSLNYECGPLGPPVSDEKNCATHCADGKVSDFANGHIYWCPGARQAYAVRGPSGC